MSDKTSTPATDAADEKVATARKNVSVQASIPADLHKVIDDHAWATRRRLREVIAQALSEYAEAHGLM